MKKNPVKLNTLLFALALCLCTGMATAQQFAFKVLGAKGDVKADGQVLKTGAMLNAGQKLEVGGGSYLGLAHHSNKTLEITKAGTYTINELEEKMNKASQSLANKYAQFVIEELTADDNNGTRFHSKAKTGSVTRDVMKQPLLFMMPVDANGISKTTKVYGESPVTVRWYINDEEVLPAAGVSSYTFVVKEGSPENIGKVIFETATTVPAVQLDLNAPEFRKHKRLFYQVTAHTANGKVASEELALEKIRSREAYEIREAMNELQPDETAISKLVLARFFEDKGLVANSLHMYEQALQLSDVPRYREYYQQFLNHYQLSKSSREAAIANNIK